MSADRHRAITLEVVVGGGWRFQSRWRSAFNRVLWWLRLR